MTAINKSVHEIKEEEKNQIESKIIDTSGCQLFVLCVENGVSNGSKTHIHDAATMIASH